MSIIYETFPSKAGKFGIEIKNRIKKDTSKIITILNNVLEIFVKSFILVGVVVPFLYILLELLPLSVRILTLLHELSYKNE